MVNLARVCKSHLAHSLNNAEHTHGIHVSGELRRVEANLHMALCCKVIYLSRTHLCHNAYNRH